MSKKTQENTKNNTELFKDNKPNIEIRSKDATHIIKNKLMDNKELFEENKKQNEEIMSNIIKDREYPFKVQFNNNVDVLYINHNHEEYIEKPVISEHIIPLEENIKQNIKKDSNNDYSPNSDSDYSPLYTPPISPIDVEKDNNTLSPISSKEKITYDNIEDEKSSKINEEHINSSNNANTIYSESPKTYSTPSIPPKESYNTESKSTVSSESNNSLNTDTLTHYPTEKRTTLYVNNKNKSLQLDNTIEYYTYDENNNLIIKYGSIFDIQRNNKGEIIRLKLHINNSTKHNSELQDKTKDEEKFILTDHISSLNIIYDTTHDNPHEHNQIISNTNNINQNLISNSSENKEENSIDISGMTNANLNWKEDFPLNSAISYFKNNAFIEGKIVGYSTKNKNKAIIELDDGKRLSLFYAQLLKTNKPITDTYNIGALLPHLKKSNNHQNIIKLYTDILNDLDNDNIKLDLSNSTINKKLDILSTEKNFNIDDLISVLFAHDLSKGIEDDIENNSINRIFTSFNESTKKLIVNSIKEYKNIEILLDALNNDSISEVFDILNNQYVTFKDAENSQYHYKKIFDILYKTNHDVEIFNRLNSSSIEKLISSFEDYDSNIFLKLFIYNDEKGIHRIKDTFFNVITTHKVYKIYEPIAKYHTDDIINKLDDQHFIYLKQGIISNNKQAIRLYNFIKNIDTIIRPELWHYFSDEEFNINFQQILEKTDYNFNDIYKIMEAAFSQESIFINKISAENFNKLQDQYINAFNDILGASARSSNKLSRVSNFALKLDDIKLSYLVKETPEYIKNHFINYLGKNNSTTIVNRISIEAMSHLFYRFMNNRTNFSAFKEPIVNRIANFNQDEIKSFIKAQKNMEDLFYFADDETENIIGHIINNSDDRILSKILHRFNILKNAHMYEKLPNIVGKAYMEYVLNLPDEKFLNKYHDVINYVNNLHEFLNNKEEYKNTPLDYLINSHEYLEIKIRYDNYMSHHPEILSYLTNNHIIQ